ncbi:hypothetical protein AB0395_37475 [Streptosporangium sp. NPDC051023]|uniref:hypothetical protein n=1 Tax=Streptosporangium sp. NPDC051023 TaxID=3155410 RepID=UPI00344F5483
MPQIPAAMPLPPGHTLVPSEMTTADLAPGMSIRVRGYGTLTIAARPLPVSPDLLAVPLGWERLAVLAHPSACWDAQAVTPSLWQAWKHRDCRACGGTGRAA